MGDRQEDATLIVSRDGEVLIESKAGSLRPLVETLSLLTKGDGLVVYDRVVGLCAAKLHSLLNPKVIYASLMSRDAIEFLRANSIEFHYHRAVETILGADNKMCAFESIAYAYDAEELFEVLFEMFSPIPKRI